MDQAQDPIQYPSLTVTVYPALPDPVEYTVIAGFTKSDIRYVLFTAVSVQTGVLVPSHRGACDDSPLFLLDAGGYGDNLNWI